MNQTLFSTLSIIAALTTGAAFAQEAPAPAAPLPRIYSGWITGGTFTGGIQGTLNLEQLQYEQTPVNSAFQSVKAFGTLTLSNRSDQTYRCTGKVFFLTDQTGVTVSSPLPGLDDVQISDDESFIRISSLQSYDFEVLLEPGQSSPATIRYTEFVERTEEEWDAAGPDAYLLPRQETRSRNDGRILVFSGMTPNRPRSTITGSGFVIHAERPRNSVDTEISYQISQANCVVVPADPLNAQFCNQKRLSIYP